MTDSTGKTADQYAFDEFGNEVAGGKQSPNASNVLHNNFGYAGEQWDSEAGLQYLRNRYYDPEVGRFINRDNVMGNALAPLTQNLYVYVSNNPINFVDPSGHYRAGLTPGTEDWYDDIQYGGRWSADQISQLQQDLNRWGFRDNNGNKLAEDGAYGDSTRFAQRMYFRERQQFLDNGHTMAEWDAMYPSANGGSDSTPVVNPNQGLRFSNKNNPTTTSCHADLRADMNQFNSTIDALWDFIKPDEMTIAWYQAGGFYGAETGAMGYVLSKLGIVSKGIEKSVLEILAKKTSVEASNIIFMKEIAESVAEKYGGVISSARGDGWRITIPNGKKSIIVRLMNEGSGGRTKPYYRVSVPNKGALTTDLKLSNNLNLTHIDLDANSLENIIKMVDSLKY